MPEASIRGAPSAAISSQVYAPFSDKARRCLEVAVTDVPTVFHVKHRRWIRRYTRSNPQGSQAFYVVFHVKPRYLWITSVDNFAAADGHQNNPHSGGQVVRFPWLKDRPS
jgi:hypothetical protein